MCISIGVVFLLLYYVSFNSFYRVCCVLFVFPNVTDYRSHLIRHKVFRELRLPSACGQGVSKSTFNRLFNFLRHISAFHSYPVDIVSAANDEINVNGDSEACCSDESHLVATSTRHTEGGR
jgi:hypothetical protein